MSKKITFRKLDANADLGEPDCALAQWYQDVRDIPLPDLSLAHIARAIRQDTFHHHVVPLAIAALLSDPWAGELYPGELLLSLDRVPADFWVQRFDQRNLLQQVFIRLDQKNATFARKQSMLEPELQEPGLNQDTMKEITSLRLKLYAIC